MTHDDKKKIVINSNLALIEKRGQERVYRILGLNQVHIYLHEIGTIISQKSGLQSTKIFIANSPPRGIRSRHIWHVTDVETKLKEGRLYRVAELGIPVQMVNRTTTDVEDMNLQTRKQVVAELEEFGGAAMLYDADVYSRCVQSVAEKFNVSANSVRKWFETYLFYAKHENALIDKVWRKGAPGVSRRSLKDIGGRAAPLGRRTDSEILGLKGKKRRRLTPQLLAKYEKFLQIAAVESNERFPSVYRRWQLSQVAHNRSSDGILRTYPVCPENMPGDDNMRRVGRQLLKKFRHERDALKMQKTGKSGGSAQDIVGDQLPVLDIDGTLASNFILFGKDPVSIDGRGQPTILLAVDRASLAIVGWNVSFGAENGDSYLNCVFSAYTPKTRELIRWEVPHLQGFVYGCTTEIFIDRGPGISMRTQESLVGRLRTQVKMAAPGSPESKPHAEQVMLYAQQALMDMAGSTYVTGDDELDSWRKRFAKSRAVPLKIYMRALLEAISRRNLETDARHLLTPYMMKRNVLPCPKDIYLFNKAYRRGDAAWDWAPEDIFRRLCHEHSRVALNGVITLKKREFTSPELKLFSKAYAAMHNGKSATIVAYEIPNSPYDMLWELPGYGLGLLKATDMTLKQFEDGPSFFTDFQNKLRNSLFDQGRLISLKDAQAACQKMRSRESVSNVVQEKIDAVEQRARPRHGKSVPGAAQRGEARRVLEQADLQSRLALIPMNSSTVEYTDSALPWEKFDNILINDSQDLLADD